MSSPLRLLRLLVGDRRASVAITFAFAVLPMVMLVGAAVDYARALNARSTLQVALDNAVMQRLQSGSSTSATNFLANASQPNVTISTTSPLTFTPNANGSVTATVNANVSTKMLSLIGVTSIPVSLTSTAKMTHPLTPHSITYQFQYAKGWYYKVVTLYVKQTSTSTPLVLATWTYKAYNDGSGATTAPPNNTNSLVAIPKNTANVPHFWDATGSSPTATGIGITTTAWNSTNATNIGATLDAANNKIIFNNAYFDLYLTMQVNNAKCAPGQTVGSQTVAASSGDEAKFEAVYLKTWSSSKLNENIACSGAANNSNWSMTVSTNSATNSQYLYINGVEQKPNIAIGLTQAFPCPSGATTSTPVTNNYEWEDNGNSTTDTRDFFFSLTTTCTLNQWSNAPNIPSLTN